MARFGNPTDVVQRFVVGDLRYEVQPGGTCDLPDELAYVVARRGMALVPADDAEGQPTARVTPMASVRPLPPPPDEDDDEDETPPPAPDDPAAAIEAAARLTGRAPRPKKG